MAEPRRRALLVGAGGHAKVVIEILQGAHPDLYLEGLLAADATPRTVHGLAVLGDDSLAAALQRQGVEAAFIAIGSNAVRHALFARFRALGFDMISAISPAATLSPSASVGEGVAVMAGAVVNAATRIGDGAIINTSAIVDHDCMLAAACHVAPGSALAGGVHVGARSLIGVGACVLPGIRIGDDVTVGAGACVTRDLPDAVVAVGVPARVTRKVEIR